MITPTVGRKVWYTPSDKDKRGAAAMKVAQHPLDATIVHVHDDHTVNLAVFDTHGNLHKRLSVELLQADAAAPTERAYAQWMPYQIKEAQREQLEIAHVVIGNVQEHSSHAGEFLEDGKPLVPDETKAATAPVPDAPPATVKEKKPTSRSDGFPPPVKKAASHTGRSKAAPNTAGDDHA